MVSEAIVNCPKKYQGYIIPPTRKKEKQKQKRTNKKKHEVAER